MLIFEFIENENYTDISQYLTLPSLSMWARVPSVIVPPTAVNWSYNNKVEKCVGILLME